MSKVLIMSCDMNNGSKKDYQLNDPKSGLELAQVQSAFNTIKEKNLFLVNGVKPESLIGTYYLETIRTDILE